MIRKIVFVFFVLFCVKTIAGQEKSSDFETVFAQLSKTGAQVHVLLRNENVKRDLELTHEQLDKIDYVVRKYNTEYLKIEQPRNLEIGVKQNVDGSTKIIGVNDTPQYKAFVKKKKEVRQKQQEAALKILLPHQQKRLVQIMFQKRLHGNRAPFGAYTNSQLEEFIGKMSETEKSNLKETVASKYDEYVEEIRKLNLKYEKELRKELPKDKQEKIEQLFGDPFLWLHTIR